MSSGKALEKTHFSVNLDNRDTQTIKKYKSMFIFVKISQQKKTLKTLKTQPKVIL